MSFSWHRRQNNATSLRNHDALGSSHPMKPQPFLENVGMIGPQTRLVQVFHFRGSYMHWRIRVLVTVILSALNLPTVLFAQGSFTKAQVADRICKVEDGVDEFQKYLDNRSDDA